MSRKPYPSEQQDRFIIRLPDGMRDKLAVVAKANGRSMNAEIVSRLEQTLQTDEETEASLADHEKRIDQLEAQVSRLLERAGLVDYDQD